MPVWAWAVLAALAFYALAVLGLAIAGRRADAVAVARLVPDRGVLVRRLARDPRVSRRHRRLLLALAGYLLATFEAVPDFIPVAGAVDDAILVVWTMRTVLRGAGPDALPEHWPGPPRTLELLLRAIR